MFVRTYKNNILIMIMLFSLFILAGCGASSSGSVSEDTASGSASADISSGSGTRTTLTDFPVPEASGITVYEDDISTIDASNTKDGYICVSYSGTASKAKIQITTPDDEKYIYNLIGGTWNVYPLSSGNGSYNAAVLEQIEGSSYAVVLSRDIDVTLKDEFTPFLYPNQFVQFQKGDDVTKLGIELSESSSDDLDYLSNAYHYVTENISYDEELAENVTSDYIPDLEETLSTKKGICFDYASLMAALLRSQGIPAKLVFGYSGTVYHAWISVYTEETGWIDNVIEFDGNEWSLLDPTLAANNSEEFTGDYISDGTNYTQKYQY